MLIRVIEIQCDQYRLKLLAVKMVDDVQNRSSCSTAAHSINKKHDLFTFQMKKPTLFNSIHQHFVPIKLYHSHHNIEMNIEATKFIVALILYKIITQK